MRTAFLMFSGLGLWACSDAGQQAEPETSAGFIELVTYDDLQACTLESGDVAQLDCFRQLADRAGVESAEAVNERLPDESSPDPEESAAEEIINQLLEEEGIQFVGDWLVSVDINPIDDSQTVALALDANEGGGSIRGTVTFIARCRSNVTEAYINWNDYLGDDSSSVYDDWKYVTIRVGDAEARTERWSVSTDSQATFAPGWAGTLLREMAQADRFVAQTTPYNSNPVTATFDTTGMAEALEPLVETCGWSLEPGR